MVKDWRPQGPMAGQDPNEGTKDYVRVRAHAHHEREAQSPLRHGSRALALEALVFVLFCSLVL